MNFYRFKSIFLAISITFVNSFAHVKELTIIGGGIAGAMESYFAYLDAKNNNFDLRIKIYEKNKSIEDTTVCNIVPSLTCDEIFCVIPRGPELVKKLSVLFSKPGGIRVDDVAGIHGSEVAEKFKQEAQKYSLDEEGHKLRTQDLLALGKMSMDLWQEIYSSGDSEFKNILEQSNFNPCREPIKKDRVLRDGYRIDLIYNIPNAKQRGISMLNDYQSLGYKNCAILTPNEVISIDPFLKDFCLKNSKNNEWYNDAVAIWRPGGCIDAQLFLPRIYKYLEKVMGTYTNAQGKIENKFQVLFGQKIIALDFEIINNQTLISGFKLENGKIVKNKNNKTEYVLCPGEAVGTIKKLGLKEPAYAGFAGVSLLLNIDIPRTKLKDYEKFNHCMEVHQEGVVLAWQARFRNNKIFIGVAGTKAFYGDQQPTKYQAFAKNRNLLQLNMINDVLPEFISWALKYDTKGKTLTEKDLNYLESKGIAKRWAGTRAVVYDGFPTLGQVYKDKSKVTNGRCTTHLGSGGASFSPAVTLISRNCMNEQLNAFEKRILDFGSSCRYTKTI